MTPAIKKLRRKCDKLQKELNGEKNAKKRQELETEMTNTQLEIEEKLAKVKLCQNCEEVIQPERLEIFPYTEYCVKCTDKHSPPVIHDPEEICAQSSLEGRNGFYSSGD